MEDYGLYVENSSGFVQIDSALKNMRVLSYGTVQLGEVDIFYPSQPVRPLVMVSPPAGYAVTAKVEHGSATLFSFDAAQAGIYINVDYVVLVPMLDAPLDTGLYVFEVYDAAGLLVFSAAENYVAIDNIFSVTTPLASPGHITMPCPPVPFGKRYFSLTYEYVEASFAGVTEWGGRLLSNGNLQVGLLGWSPDILSGGPLPSSIQTVTGYFQP